MKTETRYIVASASPNGFAPAVFPTRELADAQASIWTFRNPTDEPYIVIVAELPVRDALRSVA